MDFDKFYVAYKNALMREYNENPHFEMIYKGRASYTELINKIMENDITLTLSDDCKFNPEYFKIDYTWWKSCKSKDDEMNIYDWKLVCAVEHENEWNDWTYEVEKLDSIIAPLKIVIGFMPNDKREIESKYVEEQISKLKNKNANQEFGIILMNRELDIESDDPFGFRTYLIK